MQLSPEQRQEIYNKLNCLYSDLGMLKDEEWQPDKHSCQASQDVLSELAALVLGGNVELCDIRDNDGALPKLPS